MVSLVQPSIREYPNITENSIVRTEEGLAEVLLSPSVTVRLGENQGHRRGAASDSQDLVRQGSRDGPEPWLRRPYPGKFEMNELLTRCSRRVE